MKIANMFGSLQIVLPSAVLSRIKYAKPTFLYFCLVVLWKLANNCTAYLFGTFSGMYCTCTICILFSGGRKIYRIITF